jgi:hypothetical protein
VTSTDTLPEDRAERMAAHAARSGGSLVFPIADAEISAPAEVRR